MVPQDTMEADEYYNFLQQHKPQLLSSVPVRFWDTLYRKLKDQVFDAGETFSILKVEYDYEPDDDVDLPTMKVIVCSENGLSQDDSDQIYLIDHAWTYRANHARLHLKQISGLLERMCNLMGVNPESEDAIDEVACSMWRFNQTYSISSGPNIEDKMPVWYVMDEFGSSIQHSNDPNCRVVPFIYAPEGVAYSLLYPLKDIHNEDEVSRDFIEGNSEHLMREALLLPWTKSSLRKISFLQNEPNEEFFLESHIEESLPSAVYNHLSTIQIYDKKLKVFSDYEYVNKYLNHPKFEIAYSMEEADILWLTSHFKSFRELSELHPTTFVNQFPFEHVITTKDLLSVVCRRKCKIGLQCDMATLDTFPSWLPTTYNLKTELTQFISYYQHREDLGLDNLWICKPWNLARGLDTHITNNLNCIVRLSATGPKIVQKYVENPVLYLRPEVGGSGLVKFDVRYVILLKRVQPLEAYVYKNFFLRFANQPFELCDFDVYDKHFTVMNYSDGAPIHQMLCTDFINEFESQYHDKKWASIENKIFPMLLEMLQGATMKNPPCGIGVSPQSRALYAADIILAQHNNGDIEPKLLEVNWTPDCKRACTFYSDFYNEVFTLLFLDKNDGSFHLL